MKLQIEIDETKETKIRKVNKNKESYVTTIPIDLIKLLNLSVNDKIIWKYKTKGTDLIIDVSFERDNAAITDAAKTSEEDPR